MLGLPRTTQVNRRVAKEKLYQNAALAPQTREMIKDQIDSVFWRNKLADSTMAISAGETVAEIQIFEIQLRQRELDKRVLPAIAKAIPYKILFILVFGDEAQLWIEAAGMFYNTDWQPLGGFARLGQLAGCQGSWSLQRQTGLRQALASWRSHAPVRA